MYERFMLGYMLWMALAFLLIAEKPNDFSKFAGKMMGWWCSTAILVIALIAGRVECYKWRWFKDKWLLVSLHQFFKWMVYGMTGLTKRYG